MFYLVEGRNRKVYQINSNQIIKVPKNIEGLGDNHREAILYSKHDENLLAECSITSGGLLIMELINVNVSISDLPDWAGFFDCHQVGLDSNGNFKAYDYA